MSQEDDANKQRPSEATTTCPTCGVVSMTAEAYERWMATGEGGPRTPEAPPGRVARDAQQADSKQLESEPVPTCKNHPGAPFDDRCTACWDDLMRGKQRTGHPTLACRTCDPRFYGTSIPKDALDVSCPDCDRLVMRGGQLVDPRPTQAVAPDTSWECPKCHRINVEGAWRCESRGCAEQRTTKAVIEYREGGWIKDGNMAVCPGCKQVQEGTVGWYLQHEKSCKWKPAGTWFEDRLASELRACTDYPRIERGNPDELRDLSEKVYWHARDRHAFTDEQAKVLDAAHRVLGEVASSRARPETAVRDETMNTKERG